MRWGTSKRFVISLNFLHIQYMPTRQLLQPGAIKNIRIFFYSLDSLRPTTHALWHIVKKTDLSH